MAAVYLVAQYARHEIRRMEAVNKNTKLDAFFLPSSLSLPVDRLPRVLLQLVKFICSFMLESLHIDSGW